MRTGVTIGAFFILAAMQGCTCSSNKWLMIGRTDSPVDVDVVQERYVGPVTTYGKGQRGGSLELGTEKEYFLRVETAPEIKIPLKCKRVKAEVSVAKARDRLSYRCNASEPWKLVWKGTKRYFEADPGD